MYLYMQSLMKFSNRKIIRCMEGVWLQRLLLWQNSRYEDRAGFHCKGRHICRYDVLHAYDMDTVAFVVSHFRLVQVDFASLRMPQCQWI